MEMPTPSRIARGVRTAPHKACVPDALRILLFEDSKADCLQVRMMLEAATQLEVDIVEVERLADGLELLHRSKFDMTFVDLDLPDSQNIDTIKRLRRSAPELPIIVLTGLDDDALAAKAFRMGAQDYLIKAEISERLLFRTIRFAIERQSFRAAQAQSARVLAASESRIRTIIEANVDAMVIVDSNGMIRFANPAAARMFGRDADALIGHPFGFPIVNGQAAEVDVLCHDGTAGVAEVRVVAFEWEKEDVLLASLRDITERKRAEEERRERNAWLERQVAERTAELKVANRELESFSYSVSHDLRAPLRAIDGFSRLLLEDCANKLDDIGLEHINRILKACNRMSELTDDLLRLARLTRQSLKRTPVDLAAIAREVVDELRQQFPERAVEFVISDCPTASADQRLMKIVLENLLGNAWKFTSKKDSAQVEFGSTTGSEGEVTYHVRDNGAGFDMKYMKRLFGAFQRLHSTQEFEGTGIGLATIARIIHRHGGRVWAEGAVGVGAEFCFTLQSLVEIPND